ncbi:MAG: peptidoglycan DD-metalloendopeptidase family protein, partial [Caldilineaceae bacterium]|nr:peptidoglycan DD-metalloendopeptidase family protein [Caldilineaceae bacterium]
MDASRRPASPPQPSARAPIRQRGLLLLLIAAGWLLLGPGLPASEQAALSGASRLPSPLPTATIVSAATANAASDTEADGGAEITPALLAPDDRFAGHKFVSREVVTTTPALPAAAALPSGLARGVALSADGRIVALTLRGAASSAEDADRTAVYRYDRATGVLAQAAQAQDGGIGIPALSADGQVIAFYAWATTLTPGDTNAVQDAFIYDQATGEIQRVSVSSAGAQADDRTGDAGAAARPALSADGMLVAFHSRAGNLAIGDGNGLSDIFVHNRATGETTLISLGPGGEPANGDSAAPALSGDGRRVVFESRAANLDPDFAPSLIVESGSAQIYLHDHDTGRTRLLSRAADSAPDHRAPGNGDSRAAAISGDGQWVAFVSDATNLVPGDTNGVADIFLHDLATGSTIRVSLSSAGTQANRASDLPTLGGGRYVAFVSAATNLVGGDGNQADDIFLYDRLAQHTSRVSVGVASAWTGIQANAPSRGPAALSDDGRMVAFVSPATNLLEEASPSAARPDTAFIHARQDPPLYALQGRVLDASRAPLAGVEIAAGPQRATTDAAGSYRFAYLPGGTYTLAAAKTGYTFSPPRRTLSLLDSLTGQDFIGFPGGDPGAFLDLPLAYDGLPATFLDTLRDTDEGGWIDSWFDHDAPDYSKNQAVLLWDGRTRRADPYNDALGCFERRCYDGHDGIDFPYRDPDPATPGVYEPLPIYPAAAGRVAAAHTACAAGAPRCNGGYGNEVILAHENGYFTRYSHLDGAAVRAGDAAAHATVLGVMGSTGNSMGTHLHFAVHLDNGNGVWDGEAVDVPVDPFGWAGDGPDPWVAGAAGRRLWHFNPTAEVILLGSQGATLRDSSGTVTANLPANALAGQARVELALGGAPARPIPP